MFLNVSLLSMHFVLYTYRNVYNIATETEQVKMCHDTKDKENVYLIAAKKQNISYTLLMHIDIINT